MRLDSHQHFWKYDSAQYPWMTEKLARLRRDFLPGDLKVELDAVGLDGCIAVQARQTIEESRWLLSLADKNPIIKGVVGWVDLRSESVEDDLAELAQHPRFVGVRHVAQDEPDDRFLMRPEFTRGIEKLKQFDLAYDILIFPKQLSAAVDLVQKFPEQRFVLDHIAKPHIAEGLVQPWRTLLNELAAAENVSCKISGLVTEADWINWKEDDFRPYLDAVAEAFGPERLMFGSDWPVCLLAAEYRSVFEIARKWVERSFPKSIDAIFGGNCARLYLKRKGDLFTL
jgi:L-fuconolactonase